MKEKIQGAVSAYTAFRDGLTPRQQQLLHVLVFLSRFAALAVPFYLLLGSSWDVAGRQTVTAEVIAAGLDLARTATARVSAAALNLIGIDAVSTGTFIQTAELLVDVTRDSTGWKSIVAFTALVAAAKRPLRTKVMAVVAGTAVILAANLLRITSMVYAVTVFAVDYELLHGLLWRWGLTAAVLVSWAVWMRMTLPGPGGGTAAG